MEKEHRQLRTQLKGKRAVIRCRVRDNTADVQQHNVIPNNMSSFSLPHHALCRDTTGILPSNTFPPGKMSILRSVITISLQCFIYM